MAVSRRLRYEILRRDNHQCRYCGATAPDVPLTVDHVVPVALGGSDDPSNLVTACKDCNAGKSSSNPDQPLVDDVNADALRWGRAMQAAAAQRVADREAVDAVVGGFDEAWAGWGSGPDGDRQPVPRDTNWRASIKRFIEAGLEIGTMVSLMRDAMECDVLKVEYVWRSFCRRCWDEITARQELARELAEVPDPIATLPANIWAEDFDPWGPLCDAARVHYPGLVSEGVAYANVAIVADHAIYYFRRGLATRSYSGYPDDLPPWCVRLIQREIEDTATVAQSLAAIVPETSFALEEGEYPGANLGMQIAAYALMRLGIEAPEAKTTGAG